MSSCIKELYDYDLVKKCCRCKPICFKSNFFKNVNKKDGLASMCKVCMNKYIEEYMKNRKKNRC